MEYINILSMGPKIKCRFGYRKFNERDVEDLFYFISADESE